MTKIDKILLSIFHMSLKPKEDEMCNSLINFDSENSLNKKDWGMIIFHITKFPERKIASYIFNSGKIYYVIGENN